MGVGVGVTPEGVGVGVGVWPGVGVGVGVAQAGRVGTIGTSEGVVDADGEGVAATHCVPGR